MIPKQLVALSSFLNTARGRSQEEIIGEFLKTVRDKNDPASLIEDASILVDHVSEKKLRVFSDEYLDKAKPWTKSFTYEEGIAGQCFREGEVKVYPSRADRKHRPELAPLVGQGEIKNMVCVPISLRQGSERPFGVACFHNNDDKKKFSPSDVRTLKAYVDVLALALHLPQPEIQLDKKVFIVHGWDMPALEGLESILKSAGVTPSVLKRENRSALLILEALEKILQTCNAGFVLVTPDDEGRLAPQRANVQNTASNAQTSNAVFESRARENVIFETGLLFAKFRRSKRVSVLLKKPAKLPSDLEGMWVDHFTDIGELEQQIKQKLQDWNMIERAEESDSHHA